MSSLLLLSLFAAPSSEVNDFYNHTRGYVGDRLCLYFSLFALSIDFSSTERIRRRNTTPTICLVNMSDNKDNKHTPSCSSRNVLLGIDEKNDVSKYQIVLDEVDIGFSPHRHRYHDVTFSLDQAQTPLHHD